MSIANESPILSPVEEIIEGMVHRADVIMGEISERGTATQLLEAMRAAGQVAEGLLALRAIVTNIESSGIAASAQSPHTVIHAEAAFISHDNHPAVAALPANESEAVVAPDSVPSDTPDDTPLSQPAETTSPEAAIFDPMAVTRSLVAYMHAANVPVRITGIEHILGSGERLTKQERRNRLQIVQDTLRLSPDLGVVISSMGRSSGTRYYLEEAEPLADEIHSEVDSQQAPDLAENAAHEEAGAQLTAETAPEFQEHASPTDLVAKPETSEKPLHGGLQINPNVTAGALPEGFVAITERGVGYIIEDDKTVFYLGGRELILSNPAAYALLTIFAESSKRSYTFGDLAEIFKAGGKDPRDINAAASRLTSLLGKVGFYDRRTTENGRKVRTIGFETAEEHADFLPVTPLSVGSSR